MRKPFRPLKSTLLPSHVALLVGRWRRTLPVLVCLDDGGKRGFGKVGL